ncbi:G-type lectin S-receptor-like serine/threonine-protein kinase SD2-5 [Primulina huaijiensis]|uniref:G-type lectin S-receptor-like serine/threonine-protein kinase SD2-5 n=1 Tax=Primulina huaijiensis TaxID=1492673 RepID=UPI003CC6ED8D
MSPHWIVFLTILTCCYTACVISQPYDYPTANLSTRWINSVTANHSVDFIDSSTVRNILLRGTFGPRYACGFYCNGNCDTYLFAIFIVQTNSDGSITSPASGFPPVVWSANRDNPVPINSTLELTAEGDLELRDADGLLVWSTNTAGLSVAGMNMTEIGNLVLFDSKNAVIWQSFDHPTDALVPGQILISGKSLTASVSSTNWTEGGLFNLSMSPQGLRASIESDPPQVYYEILGVGTKQNKEASYVKFQNGSLQLYINSVEPSNPDFSVTVPVAKSAQYMKLGPDGHLRVYEWGTRWNEVSDIITDYLGECNYPMVCGKYGICSNSQCSCPRTSSNSGSFRQVNDRQPDLGCSEVTPLTCDASRTQSFLDLEDVTYFTFITDMEDTSMDNCKQACLKNCSCKAAIFRYRSDSSNGDCYLPSQIFSLMNNEKDKISYNSSVSVKIQVAQTAGSPASESPVNVEGKKSLLGPILGSTLGGFVLAVAGLTFYVRWRKRKDEVEEDYLDHVPGMPTRFSYEELASATDNFTKKLGEGGFGSVFEGTLKDGERIAVKCLDGLGQIKKSFLAEVESIGSIHHVNLVRLIGFCAYKSHRLLVYEYMCNGSLDRWIYTPTSLDWNLRRRIILDIAKGLAYLHEDCRQKIIHLDIKPQNILLDENFNAKLSDFGLSKLINRNQSQVVTTMRGTPGYLAPEWLSSIITEKVDVYSFGVVILETLCGRKNFDFFKPEEEAHLLSLFTKKAEEERLLDIIDRSCEGMESNGAEVLKVMQLAAWCLQSDHAKRPAMSVVINVLEGVQNVQKDLDYNFFNPQISVNKIQVVASDQDTTLLLPSVLSGPR